MVSNNYQVIFWDFDGVLMNSNAIREQGFELVLRDFPYEKVEELLAFHRENGGLSRYVKFTHFFENIIKRPLREGELRQWTQKFSQVMRDELLKPELLINETISFVEKHHSSFRMHIVSGSDQNELRYLCKELKIDRFFDSIHGSPKPKKDWVESLLKEHNYNRSRCILIGDSINDWEAASDNDIDFMPYNNPVLEARFQLD